MKKIILSVTAVVCMVGLCWTLGNAWAQTGATKTAAAADNSPHRVGLIDMAFLFSKYSKFEALRADLKADIESADASLKGRLEKIKSLQAEMADLVKTSKDYTDREKQITELAASAEAERKNLQRKFMREETKIYQTCYRETLDAVNKYAAIYKYTLIIRYSREDAPQDDDPQKVMQALQRQVVFNRPEDDITDPVLNYLNKEYKRSSGGAAPAPRISDGDNGLTPKKPTRTK